MITALITVLIYLLVLGCIFYLVRWALASIPLPAPFGAIVNAILVLIVALVAIDLLLGLLPGHGGFGSRYW